MRVVNNKSFCKSWEFSLPDHRSKLLAYIAEGNGITKVQSKLNALWSYVDMLIKEGLVNEEDIPTRTKVKPPVLL